MTTHTTPRRSRMTRVERHVFPTCAHAYDIATHADCPGRVVYRVSDVAIFCTCRCHARTSEYAIYASAVTLNTSDMFDIDDALARIDAIAS